MKRIALLILAAALLCACTATTDVPQVQIDTRVTDAPAQAATDAPAPATDTPTDAPAAATDAPAAPTEEPAPTDAPAKDDFVSRVVAAWEAEGYLVDMTPYSELDLLDLYGIDLTACENGVGYADAVGYTNEAVLVVADEAMAKEIEELLVGHLDLVKAQFRSYDPEAYALAEKAVLVREGGAVLLIISPNADAMLAAFRAVVG